MSESMAGRQRAFLITPFSAETANESPEVFERVQAAIGAAAAEAQVELVRADDIFAAGVIIDQVRTEIEKADVVIALCAGRNANVFFELGMASVIGHQPILIARDSNDLPFDVSHERAHFYGSNLESLHERMVRAIQDTIADRMSSGVNWGAGNRAPAATSDPLALVEQQNSVRYVTTFSEFLSEVRMRGEEVASDWEVDPPKNGLDELARLRHSDAEQLLSWLAPAVEHSPEWLIKPLRLLAQSFAAQSLAHGGNKLLKYYPQTWSYLVLRGVVTLAVAERSWGAVERTLRQEGFQKSYDEAPLLLSASFTYADGFEGNCKVAADDFLSFMKSSPTLMRALNGRDVEDLFCAGDLVLGLARCIWEHGKGGTPAGLNACANFANYYCNRISWIAREVDSSEEARRAIGCEDLDTFRDIVAHWYPALARRATQQKWFRATCDSWAETLAYA